MQASTFDKLETESGRAFEAFCAYRDLGPNRSLRAAYRLKTGITQAKSASGQWHDWYNLYEWKRRAGAWDGEQDKLRREEAAEIHRQELETYRLKVLEQARERARASTAMLEKAVRSLEEVDPMKLKPSELPAYFMAAMNVWEKAVKIEGIALGVLDESGEPLTA